MKYKLDLHADSPEEGKGKILLLPGGKEVALFSYKDRLYAIDNLCPHEGGPLAEGAVEGEVVTCPWHCWQFDIRTGKCCNLWDIGVESYPIETTAEGTFLIVP